MVGWDNMISVCMYCTTLPKAGPHCSACTCTSGVEKIGERVSIKGLHKWQQEITVFEIRRISYHLFHNIWLHRFMTTELIQRENSWFEIEASKS